MTLFDIRCERCQMFKFNADPDDAYAWMAEHQLAHSEIDQKHQAPLPIVMPARKPREKKEITS